MEDNFLEELLKEAEEKEGLRSEAYLDLLLIEIGKIKNQIAYNFSEAEKEIEIINRFVLKKNSVLDEKIKFIEKKLESFIRERNVKTITLPNGELKMHKKPDKVEIYDMEVFLKHATKDLLEVIPEQYKPSIAKIKQWLKFKPVPKGVTIIEGKPEFSYLLNNEKEENNAGTKTTAGIAA